MCVVESCSPLPICFSSASHVKLDFKKKKRGGVSWALAQIAVQFC